MRLTFLTPVESWARTAKAYDAPDRGSKAADYQLGTHFTFENFHFKTLDELAQAMRERPKSILISGVPNAAAEAMGTPPRQTMYFPYPDEQHTHVFDIDGWKVPAATKDLIKPSLTDPESMGRLINTMLRNEGFEILAEADKLVVLTSSSWDVDTLNCHIRVVFDGAIRIESLREFATALAKLNQRTIFDPAIYKAVQPQYYNPPTCIGFKDPYEGKRIFVVHGTTERVSLEAFTDLVTTTLKMAEWSPTDSTTQLPSIGADWLQTIQLYVGNERGINEPAHRAAAQLVQQVGRQQVLTNINDYAQQMYDEVWKTIARKGERGDRKDKTTYVLQRFRQYLKSACDKTFGDKVDNLVQQVNEAIEAGLNGSLDKLMSTPVIHALRELKSRHFQSFLPIKKAIIDKHKLLKTRELDGLIKAAPDDEGTLIAGGGDWNENEVIDTVLKQYDYISDFHGNKYASVPGNGDGGYRMMRVDGSLVDVFFADGLKMSGDKVSGAFGRKALSKLVGTESKSAVSTFEQHLIGSRVVAEDQTTVSPTWLNLGKQPDGLFRSAKIEAEQVSIMSHQDSKPRWFWGVPSLIVPTEDEMADKFNGYTSMMDYLMSELPIFICADDDELVKAIMWVCSTIADKSLAYLLEIVGAPGAGKSTSADLMKDLVDPSGKGLGTGADRTAFWGVTNDFISDIERRHVTILDNISKLTAKEQDMLCMVATGLRHSERILYTQSQMERIVRRPIIITALAQVITRPDLRSRVVTVEMMRAPFNPRFIERWYEQKKFFTACLLHLTAKTLKLYRDTIEKPEGMHPRDIFLACVHSALHNLDKTDFRYVMDFRLREAWEASYDSQFIAVFVRYLDEASRGKNTVVVNTRHLHRDLKKWCALNAGKEIDGVTVDIMAVPETGRGLGWELAKGINTIEQISGWKIHDTEKLANGKRYTFKKTVDNLDALL